MSSTALRRHRWSNVVIGAITGTAALLTGGTMLSAYVRISASAPLTWARSPLAIVMTFVLIDLIYYLHHRAEHASPWLWAVHEVHHQSGICDFTTSLRFSVLTPVVVMLTHLPLAALGVPVPVYLPVYVGHAVFVALLHSKELPVFRHIGLIFNSPFLHRGHHSNAPHLRGKNLGGVLVIWDRLFGTFEPRCEQVTFRPQQTRALGPVEANVKPFARLFGARSQS